MQGFDLVIEQAKETIKEAEVRMARVSRAFTEVDVASGRNLAVEIENATLAGVQADNETMNASLAEIIINLDELTADLSEQFHALREKTGWEAVVGIFSASRAESLRAARIREASIETDLQDLISKSDTIFSILRPQLERLQAQKNQVESALKPTLAEHAQTVADLDGMRGELKALDPKINELENQISVEQDAARQTRLQTQLAELNAQRNALVQMERVKLARSQTLEPYIEKGKTWVENLQHQAGTETVLINKLQTDTKQRVVLYDALTKSLKTAQQQDAAQRINLEEKAKSDERFARHFARLLEQSDNNLYGAQD